ncbi:MAG: hypothetical protein HYS17_11965 [Micavibrio aeruginosavorus]|uniref:Uncharacterized protein n=1 Tax=Micavibrio aeruginosavorus TaxID=349221 RepID=A0A7T5UI01_9BACT|nr:MAG: hypothetical protein HYS17_11965 [Micavibrio aeruginosavorus]
MFAEADLVKLKQGFLRAAESPVADQIISPNLKVAGQPGTKRNVLLVLAEYPELVHMHGCLVGIRSIEEIADADKPRPTADEYVVRLEKLYPSPQ